MAQAEESQTLQGHFHGSPSGLCKLLAKALKFKAAELGVSLTVT
jgi:hypothetical protein